MHRRQFVQFVTGAAFGAAGLAHAQSRVQKHRNSIGFSTYGMKTLGVAEALGVVADAGYEGVELALMPDFPADPRNLSTATRRDLRGILTDRGLDLQGLMLHVSPTAAGDAAKVTMDELTGAAALGRELSPDRQPPIETVLGGRPDQWEARKDAMVDGLARWARWAEAEKTVIAVKAHVSGAMHTPEQAEWLRQKVGSPWIKFNYDYSHFGLQGIDLEASMRTMLPHTAFIHVKDFAGTAKNVQFMLPGKSDFDYARYFRLLRKLNYRGPVNVEVSSQVWRQTGYDPLQAARFSYPILAAARDRADSSV